MLQSTLPTHVHCGSAQLDAPKRLMGPLWATLRRQRHHCLTFFLNRGSVYDSFPINAQEAQCAAASLMFSQPLHLSSSALPQPPSDKSGSLFPFCPGHRNSFSWHVCLMSSSLEPPADGRTPPPRMVFCSSLLTNSPDYSPIQKGVLVLSL